VAKYREAFSPSRAKDDPTDAEYAALSSARELWLAKRWEP
jgi:hypothetical protein